MEITNKKTSMETVINMYDWHFKLYPSLDEYSKGWEKITPVLKDALKNESDEKLNNPDPWGMPEGPLTR